MSTRFRGQNVLVAGGTGALGRAVAQAFLSEQAKVIVTFRAPEEFDLLRKSAGAYASALEGYPADVTDLESAEQLVRTVVAKHGHLDILVNTVGGYAGGSNLWEQEPGTFERMLSLNLRSGYVLARAVTPVMLRQKHGSIVNIASKAAVDHAAGASGYVASKAAAVAMMDSLAAEVKGSGVRVNSVLPSIIDTEANRKAMPGADYSKWPKPEEIAQVILFLCSPDANLIHGAAIPV